jgi:hypothetical protein
MDILIDARRKLKYLLLVVFSVYLYHKHGLLTDFHAFISPDR